MADTSVDALKARNNTLVIIEIDGVRVGRIQQFSESISNNVQVLAELGRDVMVEMQKGITSYSFTIASFVCHADRMDQIKDGTPFSIAIVDTSSGSGEVLESFSRCMVQSLGRDYTVGQAAIGQNAQVVTIGRGVGAPSSRPPLQRT